MNESDSTGLREVPGDAIRYWESRRIGYNLILIAVVAGWLVGTWPHFRNALTWPSLGRMAILGLLANLCYSTAYLAEIPAQKSAFRDSWQRRRGIVWLTGMLFATLLACYWIADEIYPLFG